MASAASLLIRGSHQSYSPKAMHPSSSYPGVVRLFSFLAMVALPLNLQAQSFSDPVGFNKITALGESDTYYSAPFHRQTKEIGTVESVSGGTIVVEGTPTWATSEFVYSQGTQPNTYYISFTSGSRAGMYYTITANTAAYGNNTATLTIDLNGDVIDDSQGVQPNDTFKVIPYWTLSTLFPGQQGITTSTSIGGVGSCTCIFFPDLTSPGVNIASSAMFFYYDGTSFNGPGWRKIGGGFGVKFDDQVVIPDCYVIIRQEAAPTVSLVSSGNVPLGKKAFTLATLQSNLAQDIAIALDIPIPLSLWDSQLFQSGALKPSTTINGIDGDRLLYYDNSFAIKNRSSSKIFYYYTGSLYGGPGWRQTAGGFTAIKNNEVVFHPGSGFVIRKAAENVPTTKIWKINPPYNASE
jgi:uncharacterized protein (TIGR02597 family)